MTLRVAFAGTPTFAVPSLRALHAAHRVVGVWTQPDRPAGRGRALTPSPIKLAARELDLPVVQPVRLRGAPDALAKFAAVQADVMVVVAYGLILPRELLELPRLGCLNVHASLLPRWRGAAPIQRAILAGDARTGVTIMQMDEGLDTGAVLSRASIAIGAETTAGQLHDELAELGARQIVQALAELAAGSLRPERQPDSGVTYAHKLSKAESALDWQRTATDLDRQIRAFNPWPTAQTHLDGATVKLLRSRVAASTAQAGAVPGTLLGLVDDALEVTCGRGVVQILELQRTGRKAVQARDFYNSLRLPVGAHKAFE
jgi:methionyl-tRNA formyltransferase